jgi:carboxyl-terminal processing protease
MTIKRVILAAALVILLLCSSIFGAGCSFVPKELVPEILAPEKKVPDLPSDLPPEFNTLSDIWKMLAKNYVDKDKLDAKKLSQGAAKGMMEALGDPYSLYLDPDMRKLEVSSLKGEFEGIGAVVGIQDKQLEIVSPYAGYPAAEAGLKAGDKILEIDGETTEGMTVSEAALKIRGPAGTEVRLLILREGNSKPFEVSIVRRKIIDVSVYSERKDNIGYIRLTIFSQKTDTELTSALKSMLDEGKVDGIVLDLRNNGGGLLDVAIDVASQFLSDGVVVDVVDGDGKHSPYSVKQGGLATDIPLIVLVNNGSASASEVLAGALQDYGRAKLAGQKTYGKGSVQIISNLNDGGALHLTIARWYTPKGRPINGVGLIPDFSLELEGEELVNWAVDYLKNQAAIESQLLGVASQRELRSDNVFSAGSYLGDSVIDAGRSVQCSG